MTTPTTPLTEALPGQKSARTSLIIGALSVLLSICCFPVNAMSVVGLYCGVQALRAEPSGTVKREAIIGVALNVLGLLILLVELAMFVVPFATMFNDPEVLQQLQRQLAR